MEATIYADSGRAKSILKSISVLLLAALFAVIPTVTAFASNSGSGQTGMMNSMNGLPPAAWPITIPASHTGDVTGITLNLSISNGSAPMYIILTAPNGTIHRQRAVSGNNNITAFNGRVPGAGRWTVAIQTTGVVSTATGRLTVNSR